MEALKAKFLDTSRPLFERYRALFALRNLNNAASALALVEGLGDESALFRHEIGVQRSKKNAHVVVTFFLPLAAYVLGQMQQPACVAGLTEVSE